MIAPEDRCDLCHEPAELDDSDLALVGCRDAEHAMATTAPSETRQLRAGQDLVTARNGHVR